MGLGHRLAAGIRDLTIVIGEADAEVCLFDLLGENVLLVEEEHDGCCGEVAMIADAVEQVQALVHSVLGSGAAVGHQATQAAAPWSLASQHQPLPHSFCFVSLTGSSAPPPFSNTPAQLGTHHFVVLH